MNKGHIQAERAEAISKAMNTGTTDNVENVNRERQYKVVRVYRNSTRRVTLGTRLTLEQAKRCVQGHPSTDLSMVVFCAM